MQFLSQRQGGQATPGLPGADPGLRKCRIVDQADLGVAIQHRLGCRVGNALGRQGIR